MTSTKTLILRARQIATLHTDLPMSPPAAQQLLQEIVSEGFQIQQALEEWYSQATLWSMQRNYHDLQMTLSTMYYHAICIFHSGTFDYHPCWKSFSSNSVPRLPTSEIHLHVVAILQTAVTSLDRAPLAGVLYFLPLRIAGARVNVTKQAEAIVTMLKEIAMRGFPVATVFLKDLQSLWALKNIQVLV